MVDILINASRIKYAILDELFSTKEIHEKEVNFFIDFHTIISRLYSGDNNSHVINMNDDSIKTATASIINTIGHYRRYFTKMKKKSNIYVVFNSKIPVYQSDVLSKHGILYGTYYYDKYSESSNLYRQIQINKILHVALPLVKDILNYFEGVYFIECDGFEECDVVNSIINRASKDILNIFMTNNDLNYQLVNNEKKTIILYPKRDSSIIVDKNNLFDFVLRDKKYRVENVTSDIYPIYLCLLGLSRRDVPSIVSHSMVKTLKMIDMMIQESLISNKSSINLFLDILKQISPLTDDELATIKARYDAMSASLSLASFNAKNGEHIINSAMMDIHCDPRELDEISTMLGNENIIDILSLSGLRKKKSLWGG